MRHNLPALFCCAALCLAASTMPALADGEFLQLDVSPESQTGVLAVERGRLAYNLNRSQFDGGHDWTVSVTSRINLSLGQQAVALRVGPSLQIDENETARAGAKVVAESYTATSWGSVFLLGEFNTIKTNGFLLAQFGLAEPRLGLEFSIQSDDEGYNETAVVLTWRLRDSPVGFRLGHKLRAEETFIGISLNTF